MTLPDERYRALIETRRFLYDLLSAKDTPKVPRAIRLRARNCLRHFPFDLHFIHLAEECPEILAVERKPPVRRKSPK